MTKVLTALAALVAVEEETVALDDPAGPRGSTVRHLLAHASGLGVDQGDPPAAAPGQRRVYSNAGFEVLADLIASRSETTFADYLTEAVLAPLAMEATSLDGSPAHGAVTTAADLARLGVELLAPTLVTPDTLAMATTAVFPTLAGVLPGYGWQDPNPWGLGLEIKGAKAPHWTGAANAPSTFGHFGRSGCFLWVDPSAGMACIALADRPFGPWAVKAWPDLSDAVLRGRSHAVDTGR